MFCFFILALEIKEKSMFGFVNSKKEKRTIGGEIFQEQQKRKKITFIILGIVAFALFNLLMYFITKV